MSEAALEIQGLKTQFMTKGGLVTAVDRVHLTLDRRPIRLVYALPSDPTSFRNAMHSAFSRSLTC